jgi:hypothetical protein
MDPGRRSRYAGEKPEGRRSWMAVKPVGFANLGFPGVPGRTRRTCDLRSQVACRSVARRLFTTEGTEEFHRVHGGFYQAGRRRARRFDLEVSSRSSLNRQSLSRQSPIAQSLIANRQSPIAQSPIAQSPIAQSPIAQSPIALKIPRLLKVFRKSIFYLM